MSLSSQNIKQCSLTTVAKRNLRFAKVAVSMSKFLVKLFNFPEFSSKCRVIYGNLDKIGRSLMDNWGEN